MAITQAMCTSFKSEILQEGHQLATDTIKIALYTSTASLDATTTAYSSSNEVSGTGYTATGVTLTSATVATSEQLHILMQQTQHGQVHHLLQEVL